MRSRNLVAALLFLCAASAAAQQRTFVSVTGVDNGSCSRSAPCRSFNAAVAAATTGGEVIAIDSGGYGAASITKSISIIAPPGVYAGVTVSSGAGITINAAAANVTLRGLSINGVGGTTGIEVDDVGNLHVENVIASNLSGDGMLVNAAGTFLVRDSVFRANASGFRIPDVGSNIYGFAERTRFEENGTAGIVLGNDGQVTVSDSTFLGNTEGIILQPTSALALVSIDQCVFSRGSRGIDLVGGVSGNATVIVGRTTFYGVNDPLHRNANTNSAFTFANNQVASYSYTPIFDTPLALR